MRSFDAFDVFIGVGLACLCVVVIGLTWEILSPADVLRVAGVGFVSLVWSVVFA